MDKAKVEKYWFILSPISENLEDDKLKIGENSQPSANLSSILIDTANKLKASDPNLDIDTSSVEAVRMWIDEQQAKYNFMMPDWQKWLEPGDKPSQIHNRQKMQISADAIVLTGEELMHFAVATRDMSIEQIASVILALEEQINAN